MSFRNFGHIGRTLPFSYIRMYLRRADYGLLTGQQAEAAPTPESITALGYF